MYNVDLDLCLRIHRYKKKCFMLFKRMKQWESKTWVYLLWTMGLNFKVIRNGFFLNLKIGFLFVINNFHLSMSHLVWRKLIWMYRCIQGDAILIKYRVCSILIHMALLGVVLKEDDALVTVNTSINADLTSFWCFSKTVLSFNTYSIFTLLTSEEKKFNINVNL